MQNLEDYFFEKINNYIKKKGDALDVRGLAHELASNPSQIYMLIETNYVGDDIDYVAENIGEKLTEDERERAIDSYINSDAFAEIDFGTIEWHIQRAKEEK